MCEDVADEFGTDRQAIKALFDPLLQGIVSVMDNQIVKAFAKGSRVEVSQLPSDSVLISSNALGRKLFS